MHDPSERLRFLSLEIEIERRGLVFVFLLPPFLLVSLLECQPKFTKEELHDDLFVGFCLLSFSNINIEQDPSRVTFRSFFLI